ncbi:hypothetical protein AVEN_238531-1, partial [Araneus ventricosus]
MLDTTSHWIQDVNIFKGKFKEVQRAEFAKGEAQQNDTEESEKLSTLLAESNRQVSLLNASKEKKTFNCLSNKMSYKERHGHPSDILPTGSLLNVPSHIVHSKENRT